MGFVKCNIDASFSMDSNKVGNGMCHREVLGNFIAAKTRWVIPVVDIHMGGSD